VQRSRKSSVFSEKERAKIGRPDAESRESAPQTRDAYKGDIGGHGVGEFSFVHLQNEFTTEILRSGGKKTVFQTENSSIHIIHTKEIIN
jgi:hypothetical protein